MLASLSLWTRLRTDNIRIALAIARRLIHHQAALLSLTPSMRYSGVHIEPFLLEASTPPFLEWAINHENIFRDFRASLGPTVLHIRGLVDPARASMISQYWYLFNERVNCWQPRLYGGRTFYFEFHKFDSRLNNIRAMLIAFLNEVAWRMVALPAAVRTFEWMLYSTEFCREWSLFQLFETFTEVRRTRGVSKLAICLGCFENCVEEERTWFLKAVLDQQSHSDLNYRLLITTTTSDDLLKDPVPGPRVQCLDMSDCPEPLRGFAIDEAGINPDGLVPSLEHVLRQRPVLEDLKSTLLELMGECQQAPHHGYRILDWLGRFGRVRSMKSISSAVEKLRPVAPGRLLEVMIGSLAPEKRAWAVLVHRWVKHVFEPLTVEALGHALAASTSPDDVSFLDINYEELSGELGEEFSGIIVTDGRELKFAHYSFYEEVMSLEDCKDEAAFAHGAIAEICLRYLMHPDAQPQYRKLSAEKYGREPIKRPLFLPREGLLEYPVQYWAQHYHLAGSHRLVAPASEPFREPEARNRWAEARYLLSNPSTRVYVSYYSPLPLMAALGLDDLLDHQVEDEKDSE